MKTFKILLLSLSLFTIMVSAVEPLHAQMWNSTTGAKVTFAFPVGAWGTNNYVPFPSYHDSTYKSADTIKAALWAAEEALNIDTMKHHINYLVLPVPTAAVAGTATPLGGYKLDISAHTFDSVRPLYIYQHNNPQDTGVYALTDTISVYKKVVRTTWLFKATTGMWERLNY